MLRPRIVNGSFRVAIVVLATASVLLLAGCDELFGSKSDDTTEEIFEVGRTEPGLFNEAEYVALVPFFSTGGDGLPFDAPSDVYFGYDELIYVTDSRGVHVLDRAGRSANFISIPGGASSVVQDRRLNVYVTAYRDTSIEDRVWRLPVVERYADVTTGLPRLELRIWHPFDDDSRKFALPDPLDTDEQVEFTGVGVLHNNNIYVSRKGPVNDERGVILPHNTVLEFSFEGINIQTLPLSPNRDGLRSAVNPADVMTFVHPPQRDFFPNSKNLVLIQQGSSGQPLRFSVLSILAVVTPDGIVYEPDTQKLQIVGDTTRGEGFLYEEFKFEQPSDIAFAGDNTQYWFVVDSAKDSLFVFTASGVEGVAPPPGARSTRPVVVSFGGTGSGSRQFNAPLGVAYGDRIVYVADTGNNRISRFRLNTDFE